MRIKAIPASDSEPVGIGNARRISRLARPAPRTVILQAAIDVIGLAHVGGNSIELRRRNSVYEFPCVSLIVTDVESAIVYDQKVLAVLRIDPAGMMIAVRNPGLQRFESLAAVGGPAEVQPAHKNVFRVAGIDANLTVIHRAIVFGAVSRVKAGADYAPG